MNFKSKFEEALRVVQDRAPNFTPKVGIILGSGLGPLADQIEDAIKISFSDIPHFPVSTVVGHAGALILGKLNGVPVACLKGRVHMYEGVQSDYIKMLFRMLKHLGCQFMFSTNAVGSLRKEVGPGELVMITDHINFVQINPLMGANDDDFGPRFFPMTDAYDPHLRALLTKTAAKLNIDLHEGVYLATTGPSFETPAEIRMFKMMGADTVGMSTVPDVLIARHCGLKVLGVSAVTNFGAGMSNEALSHEGTLKYAKLSEEKLCQLVKTFLEDNANEFTQ